MKLRLAVIAIGSAAMLSACSSHEEKLCRAVMAENLLNPETASFSDFKAIPAAEVESDGSMREKPYILARSIPPQGASYYRMRVRADGELGNKITKVQFCGVDAQKQSCACTELE